MKTIRLLLLPAFALVILIAPAAAQETTDNGISSSWSSGGVKYPRLDKKMRYSFDVGYSNSTLYDEYLDSENRSGVNVGIEALYFPRQAWGFGGKFNMKEFSERKDKSSYRPEIQTIYLGAMGVWRKFDKRNKNALVLGYSLGLMNFKETINVGKDTDWETSYGVGSTMEVGYDIRMGRKTFLGLKMSFTGASFTMEYYDNYYYDYYDRVMMTLDFSVGFRF